jgi:biopolymer transport protein ExbD
MSAMNFRKGRGRVDPEINLIPFIDVLLVILIFLMVTTTYSKFTELQITLPTADAEKAMDKPFEINVTIDSKGNYAINHTPVAFHDVAGLAEDLRLAGNTGTNAAAGQDGQAASSAAAAAAAAAFKKDAVVIINADQFALHQMVINVLEGARLAGFEKVTFAAQTSGKR